MCLFWMSSWYDMIWYDMIWYDIWYDMIYCYILVVYCHIVILICFICLISSTHTQFCFTFQSIFNYNSSVKTTPNSQIPFSWQNEFQIYSSHVLSYCFTSNSPITKFSNKFKFNCYSGWVGKWLLKCIFCLYNPSGVGFKNDYELLNLRAHKFSTLFKINTFQCMGKIFFMDFQRELWNSAHNISYPYIERYDFIQSWNFKSSSVFLKCRRSIRLHYNEFKWTQFIWFWLSQGFNLYGESGTMSITYSIPLLAFMSATACGQ